MISARMTRRQRVVYRRVIITGELVLETPTHLGNGDSEGPTDMALLRDGRDPSRALLTGASIAGALRSHLRAYERGGFAAEQERASWETKGYTELLFGGRKGDDDGYQSPLVINDALALPSAYELRDGVAINGKTRTPLDKTKYDLELIAAGTRFPLLFELAFANQFQDDNDDGNTALSKPQQRAYEQRLLQGFAAALDGLARGEIPIGMKKRRGFGRCRVAEWHVWDFNLANPHELLDWLAFDPLVQHTAGAHRLGAEIVTLLGENVAPLEDKRERMALAATFALDGSLLIRSGQDATTLAPDVVQLTAHQADGTRKPVLSGTSLAGVLRHRAERIANTLVEGSGAAFVNTLFGQVGETRRKGDGSGQASRVVVHEATIEDAATDLVQNRVSIDRFTGGSLDGALFNARPAFAKPETRVTVRIELLAAPEPKSDDRWRAEQAMLLLLLKDLWTGDLAVGGESSVGRGRLRGVSAKITHNHAMVAEFVGDGERVVLTHGDRTALNAMVQQLAAVLAQEVHRENA